MSKRQWLCVLGVWIIILPFIGLPSKDIIFVISGLLIIAIAYRIPQEEKINNTDSIDSTFVENNK